MVPAEKWSTLFVMLPRYLLLLHRQSITRHLQSRLHYYLEDPHHLSTPSNEMTSNFLMRTKLLVLLSVFLSGRYHCCLGVDSSIDGRYSFSLTTFDPSGKLGQVERASVTTSLGTPIIAVIKDGSVLLASPQILPSPLMQDDGTARFCPVSPNIAIAHSGISADGRVLVAAAQRLAVEHAYTFDEAIPIDLFLEELSLLFQEYTMKPAARPFGATLLVAHIPRNDDGILQPQLFRVDPSGSVTDYEGNYAVVNWKLSSDLESKLEGFTKSSKNKKSKGVNDDNAKQNRESLSRIMQEEMTAQSQKERKGEENGVSLPSTIISASLTKDQGLVVERTL